MSYYKKKFLFNSIQLRGEWTRNSESAAFFLGRHWPAMDFVHFMKRQTKLLFLSAREIIILINDDAS